MKLTVRKAVCTYCDIPYSRQWEVKDHHGHVLYMSHDWRKAFDYAYAATQPGTGDQVQHREKRK